MTTSPEQPIHPQELSTLSLLIDGELETFATGNKSIQTAALDATKFVFDLALKSEAAAYPHISELLTSITPDEAPQTRSKSQAQKRKRESTPPHVDAPLLDMTPLSTLLINGMDENQIWAQLELRAQTVCGMLEQMLDENEDTSDDGEGAIGQRKRFNTDDPSAEVGIGVLDDMTSSDEEEEPDESDERGLEEVEDGVEDLYESSEDEDDEGEGGGNEDDALESVSEVGLVRKSSKSAGSSRPKRGGKSGHPELDDGFFDLASFNAETEEAEARAVSSGRLGRDSDDEDSENMSIDLFAPLDDTEVFAEEDLETASGEMYYKDFFEPPSRRSQRTSESGSHKTHPESGKVRFHDQVRVKHIKSKGGAPSVSSMDLYTKDDEEDDEGEWENTVDSGMDGSGLSFDDDEALRELEEDEISLDGSENGQETIERIKDDLFAEDELPDTNKSTHELRMASIRDEIAALEMENVSKKDWTLMGEATSRARPHNSLLEEDLEFERVMKAVPVITEEVVHTLEARIKARILEGRFDDVVRRLPMDSKPFLSSRLLELQDTKSAQSLAQIYEDEYTAAQTGGLLGEDRDGKLKQEHDDIEKMWEGISSKLDALCNAHFTPKQPKGAISTVSNIPTATLESALPTTKSTSTMLAPEEVFAPSPSSLRARSELTPIEKRALRTKERKAKKKARESLDKSVDKYAKMRGIKGLKKEKEKALKSVVKTGKGVTVVGKKSRDLKARGVHVG